MFRIVIFKVDWAKLMEVAESRKTTVLALQKHVSLYRNGNNFQTDPLATTARDYFDAEQCLRSLFGDRCGWDVEDVSADYVLVSTTAPQSYDYGYCIEVGVVPGSDGRKDERLVAVPRERLEYQSGRYSSGMHTPIDVS